MTEKPSQEKTSLTPSQLKELKLIAGLQLNEQDLQLIAMLAAERQVDIVDLLKETNLVERVTTRNVNSEIRMRKIESMMSFAVEDEKKVLETQKTFEIIEIICGFKKRLKLELQAEETA